MKAFSVKSQSSTFSLDEINVFWGLPYPPQGWECLKPEQCDQKNQTEPQRQRSDQIFQAPDALSGDEQ